METSALYRLSAFVISLFDTDVQPVSNTTEDMRSHLAPDSRAEPKLEAIQCFFGGVGAHTVICEGTWLLFGQAWHVFVIRGDSESRAQTFPQIYPRTQQHTPDASLGPLLLRLGDPGFGFSPFS